MIRPTLTFLAFALLGVAAHAQSLEAFQGLYVGNYDANGIERFVGIDGNGSANGAADPFVVSGHTYTGQDSQGATQTLTVDGSAYSSSSYGKVHLFGEGTVTNPYFSAANGPAVYADPSDGNNTIYDPSGSPDLIGLHGNAGWSDKVTYTGFQGTGYKVNYYFRLEGSVSGDTDAGLNFFYNGNYFGPRTTQGNELWITPDYDVVWGAEQDLSVDMYAGLTTHLSQDAEGVTISGRADYANTLILEGIVIRDPQGRIVSGYNVSTASGVGYINPIQSVPGPSAGLSLAVGTLGVLRRRHRR